MWRGESRRIELLPLLFRAADSTESRSEFRLHTVGAAAPSAGRKSRVLLSAAELSNTAATAGSALSSPAYDLRAMQFDHRGKRNCSFVGDTRRRNRRAIHVSALASIPAGQDSEQMSQLRTRVQVGFSNWHVAFVESTSTSRIEVCILIIAS